MDTHVPFVVRHEKQLGDYLLLREIGRGGMGVVYEAEQISLRRHVAIKILPPYASSPELTARFEREARTAGRLHHTNIVPVFGVGRDAGTMFYVMQYIPGQGLDAVIHELRQYRSANSNIPYAQPVSASAQTTPNGRLASPDAHQRIDLPPPDQSITGFGEGKEYWRSVARIGVQVADALDFAHKHGVLHRDIKPSNLLIDKSGTVWITDFGLSKAAGQESLTIEGAVLGTLRYLPPEGLAGRADARSDVYSLGMTLYELVALRPAFPETDRNLLMQNLGQTTPDWVTTAAPSVPRDLATVIHKAIDREPGRRYQSAAALGDDLRRFLDGKPVRARWVGPLERVLRWCRRYPIQAAMMGVLGLLATTSVIAGVSAANDHRHLGQTEDQWAEASAQAERFSTQADAASYGIQLARAMQFASDGRADVAALTLMKSDFRRRSWEWDYCAALIDDRAIRQEFSSLPGTKTLGIAFRTDGFCRAVAANGMAHLVGQGTIHELEFPEPVGGMSFDARGERLVVATTNHITVFDVDTGVELSRLPCDLQATAPVKISADGARVAIAGSDEIRVWTIHDGKCVFQQRVPGVRLNHVALSGDGRRLAASGTRSIPHAGREIRDPFLGIWTIETGVEKPAPALPADTIVALAFDTTGGRLAWSSESNRVQVWDVNIGKKLLSINTISRVDTIAFSRDGLRLIGVESGVVRLWDLLTGVELLALRAANRSLREWHLCVSSDGRSLAVGTELDATTVWSFKPPLEIVPLPRPVRK